MEREQLRKRHDKGSSSGSRQIEASSGPRRRRGKHVKESSEMQAIVRPHRVAARAGTRLMQSDQA
eukprot:4884459-Pleurochrysis_carterae.AAC.1